MTNPIFPIIFMLISPTEQAGPLRVESPSIDQKDNDPKRAYAVATITTTVDDVLIGANSRVATMTHVHSSTSGNVEKMQVVKGIKLKARQPRKLSKYGYHVMLNGIRLPLKKGQVVPITLDFAKSEDVKINFVVAD